MKLVSWVPAGEEVCTAGEESCLEDAENQSERNLAGFWLARRQTLTTLLGIFTHQVRPQFDESESNHRHTPKDDDQWEEESRIKLSQDNYGWGLKSRVCDEEDQDDDAVSFTTQDQVDTQKRQQYLDWLYPSKTHST